LILRQRQAFLLLAGVVVVSMGVAALVALLVRDKGDTADAPYGPHINSVRELQQLARSSGQPIYWAGIQQGRQLEVTRSADGRVYVRYIGFEDKVGDQSTFLTVATYPVSDALGALRTAGREKGGISARTPDGAYVYTRKGLPSVYLAYPGTGHQVEVFDRTARRALKIARRGDIQPVPTAG
jgi:hypothetical protein